MARKGNGGPAGEPAADLTPGPEAVDPLEAMIASLKQELLDGVGETPLERVRRAKAVSATVRAHEDIGGLERSAGRLKGIDGLVDAAAEQAFRDRLLSRMAGLVADLEQADLAVCPACGRVEPDREGLEGVVAEIAKTA